MRYASHTAATNEAQQRPEHRLSDQQGSLNSPRAKNKCLLAVTCDAGHTARPLGQRRPGTAARCVDDLHERVRLVLPLWCFEYAPGSGVASSARFPVVLFDPVLVLLNQ